MATEQTLEERTASIEASASAMLCDSRFADIVGTYVTFAQAAIVTRLFPFRDDATYGDVPAKWDVRCAEIATYMIDRRGSEGETAHSENGTSRTYESAGIPDSCFYGMNPYVGVPR